MVARFSGTLLGSSMIANGVQFILGSLTPNANNVVAAAGQTIAPARRFLYDAEFGGAGVSGDQGDQNFKITYSDGTNATVAQSLSNWTFQQGNTGESLAQSMLYLDAYDGSTVDSPTSVYGYTFKLDSSKTIQSLTLPDNGDVILLALTLA